MRLIWVLVIILFCLVALQEVYAREGERVQKEGGERRVVGGVEGGGVVKSIEFGKYDEYAYIIYEKTRKLPKGNKLVSAVTVELNPEIQCDYMFLLKTPKVLNSMQIWNSGSWTKLSQGKQISYAINTKSATHRLRGQEYSIRGSVSSGQKGGYIRGVFKGESLALGEYTLYIYIDGRKVKELSFKVYLPTLE